MSSLRHCVVAMDTRGDYIKLMDLNPPIWSWHASAYRDQNHWTIDWSKAVALCGGLNDSMVVGKTTERFNNRRNMPKTVVGGYEVVSEEVS